MAVVGLIEFIRSTPLLVQVFFLFFVLPAVRHRAVALMAGVLALGLHFGCLLSEVYRAGLDAVPQGQWEAPSRSTHAYRTFATSSCRRRSRR